MQVTHAYRIGAGILAVCLVAAMVREAPVAADHQRAPRAGDPYHNFNFRVELDGVDAGQFKAVSGLSVEQEIIEYSDGSDPNVVRKLPGKVRYGNLTLKRGVVSGDTMWAWIQASFNTDGNIPMKDGVLILLDHAGNEVTRYNFYNAWPAKWEGPIFDASANDVGIEEIVLAVEGFEEVTGDK